MAFPRLSASMLLASLILLLYWTTSSAQSHDPPSFVVSPSYRVKRDLDSDTREKVDKSMKVAKSFLTVVKQGIEKIDTQKLSDVMKCLTNVASLAHGIGALMCAAVNMVLIFIPQDDLMLNEVKKGFEEVNRKLDSIQISNLATDVEWFNYASIYSQDELNILTSWKKFNDLLHNSQLVQNEEQKLRLAEIFVNYYENTGIEASVANFYHYLTVKDTSPSKNLNELLKKKFKCDVQMIGKYNVYFSSLLWQGMVLSQFYWKLVGLDSSVIEAKHTKMFNNVYRAQNQALSYCLNNYKHYMKEDVKEIRKGLSADNKQVIAVQVKNALDKKYNWYNWVVMVYNTDQDDYHILYDLTKITEDTITVAVGYTLKTDETYDHVVRAAADECFPSSQSCENTAQNCKYTPKNRNPYAARSKEWIFSDYAKVTHAAYGTKVAVAPAPVLQKECLWYRSYYRQMPIYSSRREEVCQSETCSHHGWCKQLLDSNEWFCECHYGYYGERCEERTHICNTTAIDIQVVPDISTINTKMKMMEVKLEEILKSINDRNRG